MLVAEKSCNSTYIKISKKYMIKIQCIILFCFSSVNQASKLPLLFNKKLNAEQQIELNKNLILLNKQQIEGNTSSIHDNNKLLNHNYTHQSGVSSESEQTTKTIQENAKNVRPIVEKLGNTNSNSLNLLHLTNKSNAHKKQAEKVPSDDFIRSNEWADVTTKKGPFETIRKKVGLIR